LRKPDSTLLHHFISAQKKHLATIAAQRMKRSYPGGIPLRLAISLLAGCIVTVGLPALVSAQTNPANEPVAAVVNGQAIPKKSVDRALKGVRPDDVERARAEVMDFLIDNTLIDQYLQQQKIAVDEKELETRLKEIRAEIEKSKKTLEQVLKDLDMSEAEFRAQVVADQRWEKFALAQSNDANLKALFDRSPEVFDGSMVRARHILLTATNNDPKAIEALRAQLADMRKQIIEKADAAVAKLPATADALTRQQEHNKQLEEAFSALAKEKSACPSKRDGGDINWFPRTGSMVEPFAAAAFALKPYEISQPVQTQFGAHLILVTAKKPGQDVKFDQVKEEVREVYCNRLRDHLVAQLRKAATIQTSK
jgi:peptidyl-prolyl cis-trans isomerase C